NKCPRGWLDFSGQCYGYFGQEFTWRKAEAWCRATRGGCHLASLHSPEEHRALATFITQHQRREEEEENVWIGLYYQVGVARPQCCLRCCLQLPPSWQGHHPRSVLCPCPPAHLHSLPVPAHPCLPPRAMPAPAHLPMPCLPLPAPAHTPVSCQSLPVPAHLPPCPACACPSRRVLPVPA
uniref:C-type lectin domain-containing protein n=1 Tax=Falco tinnunculus TaxID=100819 RepID=A0A8C4V5K3_FALTI